MKNKDKSCKKEKESTIGKIIYGFLLLMPLIAIGVTCLVSTFNMSAKEESEIHYKYETNEVNTIDDLVENNVYNLSLKNEDNINFPNDFTSLSLNVLKFNNLYVDNEKNVYLDEVILTNSNLENNLIYLTIDTDQDEIYLYFYIPNSNDSTGYVCYVINFNAQHNFLIDLDFQYISHFNNIPYIDYIKSSNYNIIESVETHNVNPQDVFYNSIDKVEQSNLFNWVENNAIYTGISNTCEQLSITNTFIPLLLTYWLIISVLYFLYDIILMILHMLHRKIHELQDSI